MSRPWLYDVNGLFDSGLHRFRPNAPLSNYYREEDDSKVLSKDLESSFAKAKKRRLKHLKEVRDRYSAEIEELEKMQAKDCPEQEDPYS